LLCAVKLFPTELESELLGVLRRAGVEVEVAAD
jgi:hypothetical protein